MAVRSGIGGQIGFVNEGTYGTYVAPTKFIGGTASLKDTSRYVVVPTGAAAGQLQPHGARRYKTGFGGAGSVVFPVMTTKMGLLLQALMGTTVTPVIIGAGPGYTQTHTLADPFGKFLTFQTGVVDGATGTANDYSWLGTKVLGCEFACEVGGYLTSTWDLISREVTEAQTLASASYSASAGAFHWAQSDFKVGATVGAAAHIEGVRGVSVNIVRGSATDRDYAGNLGKISEPIINTNDENIITGTIAADLVTKADLYDRYHGGTGFSAIWEFVGTAFTGGFETFRITLPQCFLSGETPDLDSSALVTGSLPFYTTLDSSGTQPFITYLAQEAAL